MENGLLEKKILNILKKRSVKHCAIATVDESGNPECAVMGYAMQSNLNLICMTDSTSRKWHNIKHNPKVAISIGWEIDGPFLQYEGYASLIDRNNKDYKKYEKAYFQDHPHSQQFKGLDSSVFYVIKPRWIRLSDSSIFPPQVEELYI